MKRKQNTEVPTAEIIKRMWSWNARKPWLFALVLLLNPIADIFQTLLQPLALSWCLNGLGTSLHGLAAISQQLLEGLGGYVITFLIGIGLQRTCDNAGVRLDVRVATLTREEMLNTCLAHSEHFHTESKPGELIAAADQLLAAQESFTTFITEQVSAMLVQFVGADIVLLFVAPLPAAFMAIWSVAFLCLLYTTMTKRMRQAQLLSATKREVTNHFSEVIGFAKLVKVVGEEANEVRRQVEKAALWADQRLGLSKYNIYANTATEVLMLFVRLAIFGFSFWQIAAGRMSFAAFILIQLYLNQLISALRTFTQNLVTLQISIADATKMVEILETPPELSNPKHPQEVPHVGDGISITFDNVSFRYPGMRGDEWALRNFTLHIKPGEHIAFVGPSGGAKTTILRLLLRLWDPQEGTILLNGRDIREIDQSVLKQYFSYVPQRVDLLHRTIHENVLFGARDDDLAVAQTAANDAHIHDHIMTLEGTYDAVVGERGTNLSGGQGQRLALARALARNARIFLLDEATNALDGLTEKLIQASLEELLADKTCLLVAHRLSTIQYVDKIVVVRGGMIVEQGTHSELLASRSLYSELWLAQMPIRAIFT